MRSTECTPRARILALGGYQPASEVSDHGLAPMVNAGDERVRGRAGMASRGTGPRGDTVADLAAAAGATGLAAGGVAPPDIGLVIDATSTAEPAVPNVSTIVAARL